MIAENVLKKINREITSYQDNELLFLSENNQTSIWKQKFIGTELIRGDGSVDPQVLENFRNKLNYVADDPAPFFYDPKTPPQEREAHTRKFTHLLGALRKYGAYQWLQKYPVSMVGNPLVLHATNDGKKVSFTHRWLKHLFSLAMFDKHLSSRLGDGFTAVDIGASYGIFQYLVHKERPDSHQVLVDFSEQLITARYFLQSCFPEANIAGVEEIAELEVVDRAFIRKYDFVLLPTKWYSRLASGSIDLMTSFACLGELKREIFTSYTEHPAFVAAKFYYLANPVAPTLGSEINGETDISLLDYKCIKRKHALHFGNAPQHIFAYGQNSLRLQPFFEYIGTGDK